MNKDMSNLENVKVGDKLFIAKYSHWGESIQVQYVDRLTKLRVVCKNGRAFNKLSGNEIDGNGTATLYIPEKHDARIEELRDKIKKQKLISQIRDNLDCLCLTEIAYISDKIDAAKGVSND